MKRVAIIPARGGSKRLPKKNIMPFCGRPMIAWTVLAAQQSGLFDRVLVSTDSEEIASVVREECGLETPFLRLDAADDISPVSVATLHALEQLAEIGEDFDRVVQLMANCPIRGATEIQHLVGEMETKGADSAISCFAFGWMNPWWAFGLKDDGGADWKFPEALKMRSQDLDTLYCPSGAIWASTTAALRANRDFKGPGAIYVPLDWEACVDIDDAHDLRFAEAVAGMVGLRG